MILNELVAGLEKKLKLALMSGQKVVIHFDANEVSGISELSIDDFIKRDDCFELFKGNSYYKISTNSLDYDEDEMCYDLGNNAHLYFI